MRIAPEPFDAPAAAALLTAQRAEIDGRYGEDTEPGVKPTAADIAVFLVARDDDGTPLACGALRRLDAAAVEVKRMYVVPAARGRGLGRAILAALESEARRLGCSVVRLETGWAQPEAIGLYTSSGYRRVPCWGAYAHSDVSQCYERRLGADAVPP